MGLLSWFRIANSPASQPELPTPRALAERAGWKDVGAQVRNVRRSRMRLGDRPNAQAGEGASIEQVRADAARFPHEYFICTACGRGPWHITWGAFCPDCSGAD